MTQPDKLMIEDAAKRGFEQAMRNMDLVQPWTHSRDYPWENEDDSCKEDWRRIAVAILGVKSER